MKSRSNKKAGNLEDKGTAKRHNRSGKFSMLEAPVAWHQHPHANRAHIPSLSLSLLPSSLVLSPWSFQVPPLSPLFLQLVSGGQEYISRRRVKDGVKHTGVLVALPLLPRYPCCYKGCAFLHLESCLLWQSHFGNCLVCFCRPLLPLVFLLPPESQLTDA